MEELRQRISILEEVIDEIKYIIKRKESKGEDSVETYLLKEVLRGI